MLDVEDNLFLLAGPVRMHPRVLRAMDTHARAHRSPEFTEVNRQLEERLQKVYQTTDPVLVLTASGTGAMDLALGSALDESRSAVALDCGKFNQRMAQLAGRYGKVETLKAEWGDPPTPDMVAEAMDRVGADVLTFTHNETSTGTTLPLADYAKVAHERDALLVVDGITSLGGIDVPVEQLGVDAFLSGSQKCLGGPAGLAFLSVNERFQDRAVEHPSYYLDLQKNLKKMEGHQTPFTPATHLHLAMNEALAVILEEGLENRFAKVAAQARGTRAALATMGCDLLTREDVLSDTVTAALYPEGVTDDLRAWLKDRGVIIAGAQPPYKGRMFRIGHMGTVRHDEMIAGLALVARGLQAQGHDCSPGAAVDAYLDAAGV